MPVERRGIRALQVQGLSKKGFLYLKNTIPLFKIKESMEFYQCKKYLKTLKNGKLFIKTIFKLNCKGYHCFVNTVFYTKEAAISDDLNT